MLILTRCSSPSCSPPKQPMQALTRPLARFFAKANTPEKMLALGEDKVRKAIRTIGLFRNKAKNVILLSERLLAEHNGKVPHDRDALEDLPGVGRKTANVRPQCCIRRTDNGRRYACFPCRQPHRPFLTEKHHAPVEDDLLCIIPKKYAIHAHHWLILHGRYLCKARKPECWRCPIIKFCQFEPKSQQ